MQLSATHTTNTQLFSQFLPFFNIPELKFADLRLFWFLRISREFSRNFTSRSRSRGIFISLFTLDLDFEEFPFHFSFSISNLRHFHFTFHSRNKWTKFLFHFSLLEMSEPDFHFTFHFSNFSQDTAGRRCPPPSAILQASRGEEGRLNNPAGGARQTIHRPPGGWQCEWQIHTQRKIQKQRNSSVNVYRLQCPLAYVLCPLEDKDKDKVLKIPNTCYIFSCPQQLNRWPCHWLSHWLTVLHSGRSF